MDHGMHGVDSLTYQEKKKEHDRTEEFEAISQRYINVTTHSHCDTQLHGEHQPDWKFPNHLREGH
jgi:hypothetical protein